LLKKVFIGIPCLEGKFDARFMDALINTIKAGINKGIDFCPYFVCNDPFIQRVRNDILHIAYQSNIENCIFIDSDMLFTPENVFKLLLSPYDAIGAAYITKDDITIPSQYRYVGLPSKDVEIHNGLIESYYLGFGFIKINRVAFAPVYEKADNFYDFRDNTIKKSLFNVDFVKDGCIGEDIIFLKKLKENGTKVYIDTTINIGHIGLKVYKGNVEEYLNDK
jgi:hypothetical protein